MAVYVDELQQAHRARRRARKDSGWWCHMWADHVNELHRFAERIGLRHSLFHGSSKHPHYDLRPTRRLEALRAGATVGSFKVWLRRRRDGSKTPIPAWVWENVVEGKGVACPSCGGLETRSWYSAAKPSAGRRGYVLTIHEPCRTAWVEYE